MADLIERIKTLRYIHVPQASQLFEEAIAEIERLRLTDSERQAITEAADAYESNNDDADCGRIADTLHGLLDRIGHQNGPVTEPLP